MELTRQNPFLTMMEEEHKAVKRLKTTTYLSDNPCLLWKESKIILPVNQPLAVSQL